MSKRSADKPNDETVEMAEQPIQGFNTDFVALLQQIGKLIAKEIILEAGDPHENEK